MQHESDHRKESFELLWKLIIRCDEGSKVLCPIGAYFASDGTGEGRPDRLPGGGFDVRNNLAMKRTLSL